MNIPNLGKYASVCDLPYTSQKITYHRGYGNIVVHEVRGDNSVNTTINKFNRIEPLQMPFGDHLPKNPAGANGVGAGYLMSNPETTIAWNDKRFFE
jgi:hypothetical protein